MDLATKIELAGAQPLTLPAPADALPHLLSSTTDDDPRLWMRFSETISTRPLAINRTTGGWIELARVKGPGLVNRHRHTAPVAGYTISGSWGYLEHDWVAGPGTFIYEPVGSRESFAVYSPDMQGLFVMYGPLTIIDEDGEDLMTLDALGVLAAYRQHCAEVGLGEDVADALIR